MGLEEYRRKRNFKKTTEPTSGRTKGQKPIFVVQEHWASHHHFDFRLEAFGTLKSWAVPKGPSTAVGDKRLAVEVEDHPIDYAKFKGTIPEGEYGAGTVKIWDHGVWIPPSKIKESLQKGRLEFELKGKKLKGRWLLQRTGKLTGRKSQWLLIKRTDDLTPPSEKILNLKKKGRDPWPDDVAPQLAFLTDKVPEGGDWIHELKFDGYRTISKVQGKSIQMLTRNGHDWTEKYKSIARELKKLKISNAIFDGEIVVLDDNGNSSFSALQNELKTEDSERLHYYIFDLLYLNGRDLREEPLETRKQILKKLITPIEKSKKDSKLRFSAHVRAQGEELLQEACRSGAEGIISKQRNKRYRSGRGDSWLKVKCSKRQELVIGGYTDPKGERSKFGALLMGVFDQGKFRYVGRVGTGFDEKTLSDLEKKFKKLETARSPFEIGSPQKSANIHWLKPQLIAEIEFGAWTGDQILRHASFLGLREDKKAKEVVAEKPISTKRTSRAKKFKISHPERIIYENAKLTKLDVANYYRSIAPWLLAEMSDRPLSLLRCPSQSGGTCFFQKHMDTSKTENIGNDVIENKEKGPEKSQEVIFVDSEAGLLELVQWGVLEFHTWQCQMAKPLNPDQIIFDLDPAENLPWKKVVEGALEVQDLLKRLSLKSFLKTTGGKGLHIHVPIAPIYSWDQVKSFAKTVALQMVAENPNLYTATISKNKRTDKIFIDYLRNGFGATAIAPYSLRAKSEPYVAVPIEWSELKKLKGPRQFTLSTTLERLAHQKKDPWKGSSSMKQKIAILKYK